MDSLAGQGPLVDSYHSGVINGPDSFWWFAASGNKAQRSAGHRAEHRGVRERIYTQVFFGVVLGRVLAAEVFRIQFLLVDVCGAGLSRDWLSYFWPGACDR